MRPAVQRMIHWTDRGKRRAALECEDAHIHGHKLLRTSRYGANGCEESQIRHYSPARWLIVPSRNGNGTDGVSMRRSIVLEEAQDDESRVLYGDVGHGNGRHEARAGGGTGEECTWKPDPKSRSAIELTAFVAGHAFVLATMLETCEFKSGGP